MNDKSQKRDELSRALRAFYDRENRWKTKKAFAEDVRIPYSSVKDYFGGKSFPAPAVQQRLYEFTGIPCLAPTDGPLFSEGQPPRAPKADPEKPQAAPGAAPAQGRLMGTDHVDLRPHKTFRIAVSGDVNLTRLEVDLVDTREFQRLRSIKQLGTSYLVYPSATHTRFEHSLGTLFEAGQMVHYITHNPKSSGDEMTIPDEHKRLIRLGALLHDIRHVPFGHTLEDETNVLTPRHDQDLERRKQLLDDSQLGKKLLAAIGKEQFDLLISVMEAKGKTVPALGEYAYIADIVNNTVCADLIDYLKRDVYFCNLNESFGDRFLRYLYLDRLTMGGEDTQAQEARRLIVRLWKKEISRHRRDILSELVELLRVRYCLGEKVYFHHAKTSSSAMLARAVWSAMHADKDRLKLERLWEMGDDELLLELERSKDPVAKKLTEKLRSRDLHKWAYTLSRSESEAAEPFDWTQKMVSEFHENAEYRTHMENVLADLCGLEEGDVLIYCAGSDMAKKYAEMLVKWKDNYQQLQEIEDPATRTALSAIHKSHELLWGLHVFVTRSGKDDVKKCGTLRDLCACEFGPASSTDREARRKLVLRAIVSERVAKRGGGARACEEVVEVLTSKPRGSLADLDLTSTAIDRAIEEQLGGRGV